MPSNQPCKAARAGIVCATRFPASASSWSPTAHSRNPYRETGPIFLHADGCERYAGGTLPPDFAQRPIVLRAYDAAQNIARAEVVVDGTTEQRIAGLVADPEIAWVHARSLTHGCYLFRIDRD